MPLQRLGDGLIRHEKLLFGALVLLHLLPIWSVKYLPTQDGAAHVYNALVIKEYHLPERAEWRRYFSLTKDLDPYWTVNLTLAGLLSVMPPHSAEKALVSLYVILLPLGLRYLLRAINPRSGFAAWFIFPFVLNHFYQIGFYSFCLSLALYCFALGLWLRQESEPSRARLWKLCALALLLYFTHIVSLHMLYAAITCLGLWFSAGDLVNWLKRRATAREFRQRMVRRWQGPFFALLPSMVLAGEFTAKFLMLPFRLLEPPLAPLENLRLLLGGRWTWMFNGAEEVLVRLAFWGLLAAAAYVTAVRVKKPGRLDGFFVLIAVNLALFFRAPEGEVIHMRIIAHILLSLIMWVATQEHGPRFKSGVVAAALAASVTIVFLFTANYRRFDGWWRDCLSATAHMERGRTLLYLSFAHNGFPPRPPRPGKLVMSPMRHTGCYAAIENRMVSLNNYEAEEKFLPVQYHAQINPYRLLADYPESEEPRLDLFSYLDHTPGRIDYILVWGATEAILAKPFAGPLFSQIWKRYDMVYKSPSGLTGLFRHKDLKGAA